MEDKVPKSDIIDSIFPKCHSVRRKDAASRGRKTMERYTEFLYKRKKQIFFLIIIVNIISAIGIFRIRINPDYTVFIPKDSKHVKIYEEMNKVFGTQDQVTLMIVFSKNPRNLKDLQTLKDIEKSIESFDDVKTVVGPVPDMIPARLFRFEKVTKVTEKNVKKILDFIETNDFMKPIVEKDGKYYCLFSIFPSPNANYLKLIREIEGYLKTQNHEYYISGNLYVQGKLFDYILIMLLTLPPTAILMMFLVFRWRIGSTKGALLSIIPAGFGALWTMGLISWTIREISMVTVLVPIFTIVMGSADGLHFMSHFLDRIDEGESEKEAVRDTLEAIGIAIIMTTLTTVAGFLSLLVVKSHTLVQMGLFSAIGIGFAGIATWLFLPTILLNGVKVERTVKGKKDVVTNFFKRFQGKRALIVTLLISIAFIPGLMKLKTDFNMFGMYRKYTSVRKSVENVKKVYGMFLPVFGVVQTEKDPIDPIVAKEILSIEKKLSSMDDVLKVYSFYDVMGLVYRKLYNTNEDYPNTLAKANLVFSLMMSQQKKLLDTLINRKKKMARIIISPRDLRSKTLVRIENTVQDKRIFITGIPYVIKEMNDTIIPQQIQTIFLAMILVFSLLLLTQKKLKIALLSLIPISVSLIALFGFMGYAGIDLSIITMNMASITIGVGIDYAIHYVALFKYYVEKKHEKPQIVALERVAGPVTANAFGLAIGYTVMIFSPLTVHLYLSGIMWVTMLTSSFLSLSLLPTLVSRVFS